MDLSLIQSREPWISRRACYFETTEVYLLFLMYASEEFSTWLTPDVILGTSGRWVKTRTGAGITATPLGSFLIAAHGSVE